MDNKTFISRLARAMGCDAAQAQTMVGAFATVLRERASSLDSIAIPGFGNFVAVKQAERIVEDASTGARTLLPPQIKVEFVASAMLKKQVLE